jgi:hypothetical protein
LKIDKNKIYLELARKQWNVSDLCTHIGWLPARFYQMMRRGTAPVKSVGILADAFDVSPERIVQTNKRFK